MGSGVPGRVSPPGTHVLLILGVERVHHIRRGLGIVAALLEALHRVRLGLLHGHLPSRLCTAVVDDGGAARVSPARVGAVRRGCARVSRLGRDVGLLLELRTVVDCFMSGRWGRAGVRSGRRVTCVGRKKDTRRVQHNTRPAKRPVRAGRGTTRPELGPGDDRRVIDVAQRPCPHRHRERRGVPVARARPPVAPCRSEKSRIWLQSGDCTHPLASVDSPWRTARDLYCGRSRRANTAKGLYPSASATSRPAPSPMAPTAGSSGRYYGGRASG